MSHISRTNMYTKLFYVLRTNKCTRKSFLCQVLEHFCEPLYTFLAVLYVRWLSTSQPREKIINLR